jgi:hypothetical protein
MESSIFRLASNFSAHFILGCELTLSKSRSWLPGLRLLLQRSVFSIWDRSEKLLFSEVRTAPPLCRTCVASRRRLKSREGARNCPGRAGQNAKGATLAEPDRRRHRGARRRRCWIAVILRISSRRSAGSSPADGTSGRSWLPGFP